MARPSGHDLVVVRDHFQLVRIEDGNARIAGLDQLFGHQITQDLADGVAAKRRRTGKRVLAAKEGGRHREAVEPMAPASHPQNRCRNAPPAVGDQQVGMGTGRHDEQFGNAARNRFPIARMACEAGAQGRLPDIAAHHIGAGND